MSIQDIESELTEHRDILMWTFCTVFVWFWMIWWRKEAIHGMKGQNLFWEGHEQLIYYAIMMMPPIVFKASFIGDVSVYVWAFLLGVILFAFMGKSAANYILSFFGKAQVPVEKEDTKVVTTTTTEVK